MKFEQSNDPNYKFWSFLTKIFWHVVGAILKEVSVGEKKNKQTNKTNKNKTKQNKKQEKKNKNN